MYYCSKCNLAVIVLPEKTIKVCKCDAPIIAKLETKLKGLGTVK